MFCDRATYTLLTIFIFVNYWEHPLKIFYHRIACLSLCPYLRNSRKGINPYGKHFEFASFPLGKQEIDQKVRNWFPKRETRGFPKRKHKIDFGVFFTLFQGERPLPP